MRNTVLFLVFFVLIISCKTKNIQNNQDSKVEKQNLNYIPYYLTMYKADSLYLLDDFASSYKILDSLFKIYPPLDTDNYAEYGIYLSSAVMSGNVQDIEKKVRYGYLEFGGITTLHKNYSEIRAAVNKAAHLSEEDIESLKLEYSKKLNMGLREKMLTMVKEDQAVREGGEEGTKLYIVDHNNEMELEKIFETYGYPSKKLIGSYSAYDLPGGDVREGILFIHQSDKFKTKYLPILLENVKRGICDPDIYAKVYDKMDFMNKGMQYFGSFECGSIGDVCNLSNPKKIDSIRSSIGLPHLKYYSWKVAQFRH